MCLNHSICCDCSGSGCCGIFRIVSTFFFIISISERAFLSFLYFSYKLRFLSDNSVKSVFTFSSDGSLPPFWTSDKYLREALYNVSSRRCCFQIPVCSLLFYIPHTRDAAFDMCGGAFAEYSHRLIVFQPFSTWRRYRQSCSVFLQSCFPIHHR